MKFLNNFNKEEIARCAKEHPTIRIPRQELFSRGFIQPSVALRSWIYKGRILSPNLSYEIARKTLSLPKRKFLMRAFRRQILKES